MGLELLQRHSSSPSEESAPSGDDSIDDVTCAKNGGRVAKNGACSQEITTETTTDTTTTTPYPSSSNERPAKPEPERGGSGVQDQNSEDQGSGHGIAALESNEEKTVSGEKAQTAEVKREDNDTSSEIEKMASSCSRSQSSADLRAIIGRFLLTLVDSIGGAVLTFSATVRAIIARCAYSSGGLLTFPATEQARKRPFS